MPTARRYLRQFWEGAIRAKAQAQAKALARCVAADPVHRDMTLLKAMEAEQLGETFG